MRGGRPRNRLAAIAGALLAVAVTGCSPKPIGHVTVSKSADGRLMAHVAVCHGDDLLSSLRLVATYATPTATGEGGQLDEGATTQAHVELDPARFQSVDLGPVSALPDGRTFYLHGHSDSSDVARSPDFTPEELDRLPVGAVIGAPGTDDGETTPLQAYRADPCADRSSARGTATE